MKHTAESEWRVTLENVIESVVSIHFRQTCSFDTDQSNSCQATGFVVDAARGYILTNRHVVCAGPFRGHCVFHNHEEVLIKVTYHFHVADLLQCNVRSIYHDLIYDFGFLKFDPEVIKHISVKAL
jgi:S1-C subfamily serine protease